LRRYAGKVSRPRELLGQVHNFAGILVQAEDDGMTFALDLVCKDSLFTHKPEQ